MALPGCCAGSLRAPNSGLGIVGKAGRRAGNQDAGHGIPAMRKTSRTTVFLGSRVAVWESFISPAALALSDTSEHESPVELLGQCTDGASFSEFENLAHVFLIQFCAHLRLLLAKIKMEYQISLDHYMARW